MPQEIERKFLVHDDGWRGEADAGRDIVQVYLAETDRAVVRVRIVDGVEAFLTVKSAVAGLTRDEYEYSLPIADAAGLIELRQGGVLAKTRYLVPHGSRRWEVDVYAGDNEGLRIAEIELDDERVDLDLPGWLGREVTGEARYYASRLSQRPFRIWPPGERP